MGAGASTGRRPPPEPTPAEIAALEQPFARGTSEACYYCMPYDEEVKRRSAIVVLEVGPLGFRLLRPATDDCLQAYPWGQIHSWAHSTDRFSFRYFDDGKKKVVQYVFFLRDLQQLLAHIQTVIDAILEERRSMAIPLERFIELLSEVHAAPVRGVSALDLLNRTSFSDYYFSSEQGRQLVDATPLSFDKIELAVLLHGRLIDQNRFSFILEGLEAQTDRDNVWHRITVHKKQSSKLLPTARTPRT